MGAMSTGTTIALIGAGVVALYFVMSKSTSTAAPAVPSAAALAAAAAATANANAQAAQANLTSTEVNDASSTVSSLFSSIFS